MNQDGKEEDTLVLCASDLEPQIKVGIGERRGGRRRGGRRKGRSGWLRLGGDVMSGSSSSTMKVLALVGQGKRGKEMDITFGWQPKVIELA